MRVHGRHALTALFGALALVSLPTHTQLVSSAAAVARTSGQCPGSPNQCSLHGTCVLNGLGERVCNCQWGYDGSDCAKKMCPHGFDPDEPRTKRAKQLRLAISASAGVKLHGMFVLTFHSHSVEFDAPLDDATSDACTQIFQRFQNLGEVTCDRVEYDAPSRAVYAITLHSFPLYPIMNNLFQHRGDPPATAFWCDASRVTVTRGDVACTFEERSSSDADDDDNDVREYAPCSNRGLCNDRTGVCTCASGYYGEHCGSNKDDADILVAPSTGPFFHGNVLRVSAARSRSSAFNLVKADVQGRTMFSVNGNGDTTLHAGSLTVVDGDVVVQRGRAQIRHGGSLAMDRAELHVTDAQVRIQQTTRTNAAGTDALLLLELRVDSVATDLLRVATATGPVFRVSGSGTTVVDDGGIDVLRGGVRVQRGGLHVLSDGITLSNSALAIDTGELVLQSSSMRLQDGHASIATSSVHLPALDVARKRPSAAATTTTGGVLELHSAIATDTLLLAKGRHDVPVFAVHASGQTIVHAGGLVVNAGGVHITSGGQTITSGGLRIESGGATIHGELVTRGGLRIADGGFSVQHNATNAPSLRVLSTNAHFAGALLAFDLSHQQQQQQHESSLPFRLLEALDSRRNDDSDAHIISIDSHGNVVTRGDIVTTHSGKIVASGALVSKAQVVLGHANVRAGPTIAISHAFSYVKITDDGDDAAANAVSLETRSAFVGQLLVLQNDDAQALRGDVSVKPATSAIFLFDGVCWRALTAAAFDTAVMTGVTTFEAANDLNVGDVKLTAKRVQVAGQRAGHVALYGKGGELTQDATLAFDAATHTLSTHTLRADVLQGSIDLSESELHHVAIVGGHIRSVNLTSIEHMEVDGELFVEMDAFFSAGITVDGQVMGSGAYVDASDARFKTAVAPIRDALDVVCALQGVEYSYDVDAFPRKRFPRTREVGFIAQDVQRVLPHVVTTDAGGFQYVAYARIVPVVVEAVKQLHDATTECAQSVAALRADVAAMQRVLAQQQQVIDALVQQVQQTTQS